MHGRDRRRVDVRIETVQAVSDLRRAPCLIVLLDRDDQAPIAAGALRSRFEGGRAGLRPDIHLPPRGTTGKCDRWAGHNTRDTMLELLGFISYIVELYKYVVIASVIMSWLISFNVINLYNPVVRTIWDALGALTEPLLRPIRGFTQRLLPNLRGIDISPIFLLLGCIFVQSVVIRNLEKLVA